MWIKIGKLIVLNKNSRRIRIDLNITLKNVFKACQVFGRFLILDMSETKFKKWLVKVCGADTKSQTACYDGLKEWYNRNFNKSFVWNNKRYNDFYSRNQQPFIDVKLIETLLLKLLNHDFILRSNVLIFKILSMHVNRKESYTCIYVFRVI